MSLVGRIGQITAGEYLGWWVAIRDDAANTGGIIVEIAKNPDFGGVNQGFDSWVANEVELERFLHAKNWQVEWVPPGDTKT